MRFFGSDVLTVADELTDAYVTVFTAPPWITGIRTRPGGRFGNG